MLFNNSFSDNLSANDKIVLGFLVYQCEYFCILLVLFFVFANSRKIIPRVFLGCLLWILMNDLSPSLLSSLYNFLHYCDSLRLPSQLLVFFFGFQNGYRVFCNKAYFQSHVPNIMAGTQPVSKVSTCPVFFSMRLVSAASDRRDFVRLIT